MSTGMVLCSYLAHRMTSPVLHTKWTPVHASFENARGTFLEEEICHHRLRVKRQEEILARLDSNQHSTDLT